MLKFLILLLTLPVLSTSLAEDVKSVWSPIPPTIDGDGDEWRDVAFNYFDNDKTAIAVKNDSAAIYLMVISRDEPTIIQFERAGIVVWLNGDGKKNRDYGLRYQAGRLSTAERKVPDEFHMGAGADGQREKMEEEQARLRKLITVIDKKNNTEISSKGDDGPAAAATFGKAIYAVEFKIPIIVGADSGYGMRPKSESNTMLGVEIGYMSDADKRRMRELMRPPDGESPGGRMGGPPPDGMGGDNMGGRGPGGGQGRPGGMRDATEKEFWLKFQLAAK